MHVVYFCEAVGNSLRLSQISDIIHSANKLKRVLGNCAVFNDNCEDLAVSVLEFLRKGRKKKK